MRLYPSLFAYLNESPVPIGTLLHPRDRPIIALDPKEELSASSFLIPIADRVYEIAFPYLKPTDISQHPQQLEYVFPVKISGHIYHLHITDEVLDIETIKDKQEITEWEHILETRLDNTTSFLIRILVGNFANIFDNHQSRQPTILVSQLQQKLNKFNVDEANIPIVISLERRYQLRRKLEAIASHLRHQLRRQAELIPLGRIQEMDSYCLRDYIRRPGSTPAEKAGAKQQLMGIQRYQDFNTAENKFLVYFSQILYFNCYQYQRSGASQYLEEIRKFSLTIDLFKQQPVVQDIQDRRYQFTKPNYVLQQNPIYRSFYQAYLEYIQKKYEKERLWSFRNYLLADSIYVLLTAALLRFQNIGFAANLKITGTSVPEQGRYIDKRENLAVKVFLKNQVYVFSLKKTSEEFSSDLLLTVDIHQLDSAQLEFQQLVFPIWVFWYRPSNNALTQINQYLNNLMNVHSLKKAWIFYLQVPPNQFSPNGIIQSYTNSKLTVVQLPDIITTHGFSQIFVLITHLIQRALEFPV
ncbi:DUF2357 domain-containing protein [Calothrix sp. FACHB-1219]|uniref:DUF2357 domain-containing protein n=1 Tax=unclassified Calothrix TaxID=2619626 RepID=UPI001682FAB9|nr:MULTISPECIES: DUF2357 domain-containing protein [unclassified Calothrix]MBD2207385.1 DUF2357 domain-containing protein [Calothrix sp. FACHB-168]MBD2218432.1 DUF2357 domain-containing protein [Calothrix sp. FACHB-1219]